MQDLNSLVRDQTHVPCKKKHEVLTIGPPSKSQDLFFKKKKNLSRAETAFHGPNQVSPTIKDIFFFFFFFSQVQCLVEITSGPYGTWL